MKHCLYYVNSNAWPCPCAMIVKTRVCFTTGFTLQKFNNNKNLIPQLEVPVEVLHVLMITILYPVAALHLLIITILYPVAALHLLIITILYPVAALHLLMITILYPVAALHLLMLTVLYPVAALHLLMTGFFPGSSHTSDFKMGTPVATLIYAWRYRVSVGTGRPGVSIL